MGALVIGAAGGVLLGVVYLFSRERAVRRTLASSVLLGVIVGVLVELARRPIFTAVFSGVATIVAMEFIRWVLGRSIRR